MRAREITETTDYFRRREREEKIISGLKPARKKQPSQTSDYARRREQERKKEQGVAEGKEDLHAQLQAINQKLKLMKGGPVGEPNSIAFVGKRKELLKQKEQILSQLKQGVAEGSKKIPASNKPVDPKDLVVSLKDVPVKKPRGHKQYDPAKEFPGVKVFQKQGVAEGSAGNWYVRVRGKVLKDKQFNAIPFPSKDEALQKAFEIHNKKRTPLEMIKLTQSWMDGPEQGVQKGS